MSAVADSVCVRCGSGLASGQEYCITCGLRRPGSGRFGVAPVERRALAPRLLGLAVVAVAGLGLAVYVTRDESTAAPIEVATGGSVVVTAGNDDAEPRPSTPAAWPAGEEGWTIVVVSIPKVQGRQAALDVASAARGRGLQKVGVIDSSRYASLHPGYWVVFSDRYASEAEAAGALLRARTFAKSARVQRIVP